MMSVISGHANILISALIIMKKNRLFRRRFQFEDLCIYLTRLPCPFGSVILGKFSRPLYISHMQIGVNAGAILSFQF